MSPKPKQDALQFPAESASVTAGCDPGPPAGGASRGKVKHHAALSLAAVDLVAERFRILGEPLRVRIIQELQNGERSVSHLAEALGASQPNISKHLRLIQGAGIAGRRHDGNLVYYFITDESVFDLCDAVCNSIGEKLSHEVSLAEELNGGMTHRK